MRVVLHRLLTLSQPEIVDSGPRRPSAGLRHYIPLFFLAPSMLLLVHAWNRTAPPEPRLVIEIDAGGFTFPRDVRLEVAVDGGGRAPVRGHRASLPMPADGGVRARLRVSWPDGERAVPVGEPAEFRLGRRDRAARRTLAVTPAECARALDALRSAR